MRQFIKFFFASCLGVLVAFIALIFLFFVFIAALAGSGQQAQPVTDNSVLHLKFDQSLPELTNNTAINPYDIYQTKVLGLSDYKYLLETAAADDSDHEAIVSDRMQWRSPGMGTPLTAGAYIRNRTQSHEWEGSGCGFSGLVCWVRS